VSHGNPKKSEISAARTPEPIKELLRRIVSTARGVPVGLRVLNLNLLEMVAPAFFQSLSESAEQDERSVFSPDGHVVAHGSQFIRQPLDEIDNRHC
jgi:predicted HD phosphohydrolase